MTLRERAEAGNAAAQHEMAERYANGRGVGRDFGVTMLWYVRAAERGHVPGEALSATTRSPRRGSGEPPSRVIRVHSSGSARGSVRDRARRRTGRRCRAVVGELEEVISMTSWSYTALLEAR